MVEDELVWLITGANSGFGLELSLFARSQGHTVVATARSASKFPSSLRESGAHLLEIEITATAADINKAVDGVVEQHGRLDVLVNNAGFVQVGAVEEVSEKEARYQFDVNFFGLFNFTKAALPHMRKQRSGTIVQVSSITGIDAGMGSPLYSASKFAVEGLSEGLSNEVRPLGIRVLLVEPGMFRTQIFNEHSKGGLTAGKVDGYEDVGSVLGSVSGQQAGDTKKGSQRIFEAVTKTGMSQGKAEHLRLVLGSDAYGKVDGKLREMRENLETLKDVSFSTDF